MLIFSSPQNPTGRVFSHQELEKLTHICLKHDILIVVSEIWSGLILQDKPFVSLGAMSENIWDNLILLNATSKTFNTSGYFCGFMVIKNKQLREKVKHEKMLRKMTIVSELGRMTTKWCIEEGKNYQQQLISHLRANRQLILDFFDQYLPHVPITTIEATYIAWFDLSALGIDDPSAYLLEQAKVHLSQGASLGLGQEQFVRMAFACPSSLLEEALERIKQAC